jgi:hypothetical protein
LLFVFHCFVSNFLLCGVDPFDEMKRLTDFTLSEAEGKVLTSAFPSHTMMLMTGKMSPDAARDVREQVRLCLYTATRDQLREKDGYVFDGRIELHSSKVLLVKAAKGTRPFVAKITAQDLTNEFNVSRKVHENQHCPTVMRAEAVFSVDGRADNLRSGGLFSSCLMFVLLLPYV